MTPHAYLRLTLGMTAAALVAIFLFSWVVDPLGLRPGAATAAGDGAAAADTLWQKAFAVTEVAPATVILGTSRAQSGLDGGHPGFPDELRPVYNLSLGGLDAAQMRDLLVHAAHAGRLRMAVVGLDLESFLPGGRTDFDPAFLAGNLQSAPPWTNRLRLNLSWRALEAGVERLLPARNAPAGREVTVGTRGVVQINELVTFHSRLAQLFPPWRAGEDWSAAAPRAAAMAAFREMVSFARRSGIDLRLFVSPVHARYLELYRQVGWWPLFESWKRELVGVLAEEAGPGRAAFPLWDFSGFNAITMERLPPASDPAAPMRWYLDSSHYSPAHGGLILERLLGRPSDGADAPGVLLTPGNLEAHLRRSRSDADAYRAANDREVAELAATVRLLRRFARAPGRSR